MENQILNRIKEAKIFIVEDDSEIANWIKMKIVAIENLHFSGAYYKYAGAYEKICEVNPDIVVLDLKLPDGNGLQILKRIKQDKLDVKVIVFSMNTQAKNTCLRYGADYFFDKSSETENFIDKLEELSESGS